MKIKYQFANGTESEVEVNEDVGTLILDSRRQEDNLARKERYHCYSYDAIEYEGEEYCFSEKYNCFDTQAEEKAHIQDAFNKLTDTQQRRLLMLAKGMSIREIARAEKVHHSAVEDSVKSAKNKFLKYFSKTPRQNAK